MKPIPPASALASALTLSFALAVWLIPTATFAQLGLNLRLSEGWKTDFSISSVDFDEIRSGGPPRDGILSIDQPSFVPVEQEHFLDPREPVISLAFAGEIRAYPLSVLTWHEIVNDEIDGKPVAVTYCPLCNAAIAFEAEANGKKLQFGTTGRLRKSDLIMYDRQTHSWWQQFSGEAIIGELTGAKLKLIPTSTIPWGIFRDENPDALVLVPNNRDFRPYGSNPYAGYDTSRFPFLYSGSLPEGILPMERVVIVERESDSPLILRMETLREAGAFERDGIVVQWSEGMASALDARKISQGRDTGYVLVEDENGKPLVHHVSFAFVAHAFHPEVEIIGKK